MLQTPTIGEETCFGQTTPLMHLGSVFRLLVCLIPFMLLAYGCSDLELPYVNAPSMTGTNLSPPIVIFRRRSISRENKRFSS